MSRQRRSRSALAEGGFLRGQLAGMERANILDVFGGHVAEVMGTVNDGKEATVYCCRALPHVGVPFLAAKVYRARKFRAFSNDLTYFNPDALPDRRLGRAMRNRSAAGRDMAHTAWVRREWDTLRVLHAAGADVPAPYDHSDDAVLMEYVGGYEHPARRLVDVRLPDADVAWALDRILANVRTLLRCDRVHGDLSAYNVLWQPGRLVVIDLPQSVDARTTPGAFGLLARDVANVCAAFARYGCQPDAARLVNELWSDYLAGVV